MGWFQGLFGRPNRVPKSTRDLGVGLWQNPAFWEIVRVLHDPFSDTFYFAARNHVYGAAVGGYGKR
ncbi:MAG: hypothetical protein PVG83_10890, partial [Acidimicrobiia bacterium]